MRRSRMRRGRDKTSKRRKFPRPWRRDPSGSGGEEPAGGEELDGGGGGEPGGGVEPGGGAREAEDFN